MDNIIPIVFITDSNFIMQTSVAMISLIENKENSTIYDIYVLASECQSEDIKIMKEIELQRCFLTIIPVTTEKYSDINQLAHIPIACLLKFDICNIIREYDKIIYLDGDIIIREDLGQLYSIELGDDCLGGVLEPSCIGKDFRRINAGILLMNLKRMRDEGLSEILIQTRRTLGDRGSMDQQTMNLVLKNRISFLPVKYNCMVANYVGSQHINYSINEINSLYHTSYGNIKELIDDSAIIHYATGFKPWIYTYAPCEKIWFDYYLKSPYGGVRLRRIGKLRSRMSILWGNIRENGLVMGSKKTLNRYFNKSDKNRKFDWE